MCMLWQDKRINRQGSTTMKDFVLDRAVWFSAIDTDKLAHVVARDMINRRNNGDAEGYENLMRIVRRYE
jgi:hypothetical protein